MLQYPITIEPDGDGYLVTCPDLPEVTSDGDTIAEAIANGADAVEEALAGRLDDFEDIPHPGTSGNAVAYVSSLIGLKVLLAWGLREQGLTRADLTRATGWHRNQVDRLFDPRHATRLDQFDAAFAAIGKRIEAQTAALDLRSAA
ncbi:type II toxin-antitoxin system HicB family antitoxin [Sinirhodobacter huangdaonensis]|uniref:Type II toxin-antitoxin system HicB family antitoxin n=1 Tax=Paenirhodobacter huangdaonensis TaxID=2501515 RepID=A0A3S3NDF3_9RHOB|nr:type II toxin-antitoxin system HicB family antitoxin [Sinirhodobacter huangdaonensis]RWR54873.1 type II toxin-antitoxin system HicB family antitoxin [Sinirhodobacter huangdaonensis]